MGKPITIGLAAAAAVAALAAMSVYGTGFGLKPGLWQSTVVKRVVDGRDMSAQLAAMGDRMQQAMANMPPEQRARMESMMKGRGAPAVGSDGSIKMCISPEEASRDAPVVDRGGHCPPASVSRNGNHSTFTFERKSAGMTITGKGESTSTGDTIVSEVDTTATKASGESHVTHTETRMSYLGSDCGDVKPLPVPAAAH